MTEALHALTDAPHLLDGLTGALGSLTAPMAIDVLSDVLRVVRLSGAVFFTADFSSPWAVESPPPAALASLVGAEVGDLARHGAARTDGSRVGGSRGHREGVFAARYIYRPRLSRRKKA